MRYFFVPSEGKYDNGSVIIVGRTKEIKSVYNSIFRNRNCNIIPQFVNKARFANSKSMYAINLDFEESGNIKMCILNSDTVADILMNCNGVTEIEQIFNKRRI